MKAGQPIVLPPALRLELDEVTRSANTLLRVAQRLGTVVLVTAGNKRWYTKTLKAMPLLDLKLLSDKEVIFAVDDYHKAAGEDGSRTQVDRTRAKAFAMNRVVARLADTGSANVISIGDGRHERAALHQMMKPYELEGPVQVKTLKFLAAPPISVLRSELVLAASWLPKLCQLEHDVDADFAKPKAEIQKYHDQFAPFVFDSCSCPDDDQG